MFWLMISLTAAQALKSGSVIAAGKELYPSAPLMSHKQGTASITLTADAEGYYSTCQVTHGTGSDELDAASCGIVQSRARNIRRTDRKPLKLKLDWRLPATSETEAGTFEGALPINIAGWVTPDDYPTGAWMHDGGGTTKVNFDIMTDGSVDHCQVIQHSGRNDLDYTSCYDLLTRGAFLPALDANGIPRVAHGSTEVRWWTSGYRKPTTPAPQANAPR